MADLWVKERDRQLEYIAQEKQIIASEKANFQVFNKLKLGFENSTKAEVNKTNFNVAFKRFQ